MLNRLPDSQYGNLQKTYQQTSIQTAPPEQLLIMLYSAAIKHLHRGKLAIQDKKYDIANQSLCKVQEIIAELNNSLNMEKGGVIAANLRSLYEFYNGEVVKANLGKDSDLLEPVISFFETFRDVWIEAAKIVRMGAK
jgi:flagellar protein FliS